MLEVKILTNAQKSPSKFHLDVSVVVMGLLYNDEQDLTEKLR